MVDHQDLDCQQLTINIRTTFSNVNSNVKKNMLENYQNSLSLQPQIQQKSKILLKSKISEIVQHFFHNINFFVEYYTPVDDLDVNSTEKLTINIRVIKTWAI